MDTVNIREARKRLSAIVDAAERGRLTVITRRGRRVARVEPVEGAAGRPLPDLAEFRESIKSKGKPLSKIVIDHRKEARY